MRLPTVDLVVIGDANVDVYARVKEYPQHGGCAFGTETGELIGGTGVNTAVAAARLGLKVALVTGTGRDSRGRAVRKALRAEGVMTRYVRTFAEPTGSVLVMIDEQGERTFFALRIGCADWQVDETHVPAALLNQCRAVYVTGVVAAEAKMVKPAADWLEGLLTRASRQGVATFFDPNVRAEDWQLPDEVARRLRALAGCSDYYLPNSLEHQALATGASEAVGRKATIIKAGAEGCRVVRDGQAVHLAAPPASVVDTTGAGDSFNAGFIVGILEGRDEVGAAKLAMQVAALTISTVGTLAAFPTRDEVTRAACSGSRG